jgi:hypothetical protein
MEGKSKMKETDESVLFGVYKRAYMSNISKNKSYLEACKYFREQYYHDKKAMEKYDPKVPLKDISEEFYPLKDVYIEIEKEDNK